MNPLLQPDHVMKFCKNNDLQLIMHAHGCMMHVFEQFVRGELVTPFFARVSIPNLFLAMSAGITSNTMTVLVLGRELVVALELLHPLLLLSLSVEEPPEQVEDTWMQVLTAFLSPY